MERSEEMAGSASLGHLNWRGDAEARFFFFDFLFRKRGWGQETLGREMELSSNWSSISAKKKVSKL